MVLNAPYSSSMEKEVQKAANIINSFFNNSTVEADSAIPAEMIRNCAGLAFLTVIKAGMIWTGKIGTGLVIARLDDGSWSAPSGIGTAGLGFGAEIGGEIIDFMIVLGSKGAVNTFKKGTQVSVGAGLELAVGPLGRAAGGSVNASGGGLSANYTYSRAKGAFAGVGLHGSTILVRGEMNRKFYGRDVTPMEILNGHVQAPQGSLDRLLEAITMAEGREGITVYPSTDPRSSNYSGNVASAAAFQGNGPYVPSSTNPGAQRHSSFESRSSFNSSFNNGGSSTASSSASTPSRASFSSQPSGPDPRLSRYSTYKSEKELYEQYAKSKSPAAAGPNQTQSYGASSYAAPAAAPVGSYGVPVAAAAPVAPASYGGASYGYSAAPAAAPGYQNAPPAPQPEPAATPTRLSFKTVPVTAYVPNYGSQTSTGSTSSYSAPSAPRAQAPPLPPPAVGAETKQVYTDVINFVSTKCPYANVQVFKDNCRLFGQDQLSLDAYMAYLTSICTTPLLKELVPQLVRLLPTQDKRENLWAIYVREVLMIR